MNKERQRKLAARARRMESLHPTSKPVIVSNELPKKKDVEPTMVTKPEKKQIEKTGSTQVAKTMKKGASKKKHNSKGVK